MRQILRHNEELLLVVRQYPLMLFRHFFIAFLFLFLPFVFIFPLFDSGTIGKSVFFAVCGFGALLSVRAFVMWYCSAITLTTERLIQVVQHGFFARSVSEINLGSIQHSSYERKGIFQTLLRYGSVIIQTYSGSDFTLKGMARPQTLHNALVEARQYVKNES